MVGHARIDATVKRDQRSIHHVINGGDQVAETVLDDELVADVRQQPDLALAAEVQGDRVRVLAAISVTRRRQFAGCSRRAQYGSKR